MSVYTVDYGHTLSGGDTGARGNNLAEENITREIGNLVVQGLRKEGHTVYPIQLDYANTMVESLNYRVNKIISINPTQSISIHINAATSIEATGVEVWGDNLCKDMCLRISDNISKEFGIANRGFKNGCEDLALVGLYGLSNIPALLVECFFISNTKDCSKYNAQKYADCIVSGILNKKLEVNKFPLPLKMKSDAMTYDGEVKIYNKGDLLTADAENQFGYCIELDGKRCWVEKANVKLLGLTDERYRRFRLQVTEYPCRVWTKEIKPFYKDELITARFEMSGYYALDIDGVRAYIRKNAAMNR